MNSSNPSQNNQQIIALIQCSENVQSFFQLCNLKNRKFLYFDNGIALANQWEKQKLNIVAIISESEILSINGISLIETLHKKKFPSVPFCLVLQYRQLNEYNTRLALNAGVADFFAMPLKIKNLETRLNFLIERWDELNSKKKEKSFTPYKTPVVKRLFDLFFAGLALLCLSPLFLIIYLLIRLESKGPVFYYSLRVGTGYRIFKFFKFRSMYADADKRLKDLKHLNQYNSGVDTTMRTEESDSDYRCDECINLGISCKFPIFADNIQWCEKDYIENKKTKGGSAFFKLKDDPRITRIGKFIRNTSIDELPQLWNVIIGDMSIVGNRPLPLYEAEKLTTDKYALRFLAPAGITGLWQVEKRGKGEMSEEERLMLDNVYAKNHSFLNDIKLILKTIPALFQKESV